LTVAPVTAYLPFAWLGFEHPLRVPGATETAREPHMPQYKVVEMREGMIGGKMSGSKLEKVLNEHAAEGWTLKAITSVEVKGRIGPGGVDGVLITFERL